MKYLISLQGMHCSGCANLITMSLEDADFTNIAVNLDKQIGTFESEESNEVVKKQLEEIFSDPDLKGYSYTNLTII